MYYRQISMLLVFVAAVALPCVRAQVADTTKANEIMKNIKFTIQFKGFDYAAGQVDTAYYIYKAAFGEESAQVAAALHSRGLNYYFSGDQRMAIYWYEASLAIREKQNPLNLSDISQSYNNLGLSHTEAGEYRKALEYHEKALAMRLKINPEGVEVAHSWGNLGQVQGYLGEYYLAESYCRLALQRLGAFKKNPEWVSIASVQNNLAGVFLAAERPDSALVWFDIALASWNLIDKDKVKTGKIHVAILQNKGAAYLKKREFAKAKAIVIQAINFCLKRKPNENEKLNDLLIDLYSNQAGIWIMEGKADSAFVWAQKSIAMSRQVYEEGHWTSGKGFINLASAYSRSNTPNPALSTNAIDSAFLVLGCDKMRPSTFYALLDPLLDAMHWDMGNAMLFDSALTLLGVRNEFEGISQRKTLLDASKVYLECSLAGYFNTGELLYLERAEALSLLIDHYLDYCRAVLADAEARQLIQANSFHFYERSIYIQHILRQNTGEQEKTMRLAFYLSEKSKALTLLESMGSVNAWNLEGIDPKLLEQAAQLRAALADAEKKYFAARDAVAQKIDTSKADAVKKQAEKRNRLGICLEEMARKRIAVNEVLTQVNAFEKFQKARQTKPPITIEAAQKLFCDDNSSLLSYLVGDTSVFVFVLNKETADLIEISKNYYLDQMVDNMRKNIENAGEGQNLLSQSLKGAFPGLADTAHQLYNYLIAPIADKLKSNVVLIPDGKLCALPFEALLSAYPEKPHEPPTWPFLVHNFSFCYGYSASLLREMKEQPSPEMPNNRFAGFAPWYDANPATLKNTDCSVEKNCTNNKGGLEPLPCSGEEIYCIGKKFQGKAMLLYGKNATLEKFRTLASNSGILHLSLHGEADEYVGNNAFILFDTASRLYVRDLYNMAIQADLVVLSACKTGLGNYRRGEGIISMARGFALAGAKSIIQAIWSTQEGATRLEMVDFYEIALKSNNKKSIALTIAKRTMAKSRDYAHPFCWAGFLLIGDDAPLHR
jgi:CHAT domain-containing protein